MSEQPPANLNQNGLKPKGISTQAHLDFLQKIMYGIVIALFLAFFGFLVAIGGSIVNRQAERKATYEDLKDKIVEQNYRIEQQSQRIDDLTKELRLEHSIR